MTQSYFECPRNETKAYERKMKEEKGNIRKHRKTKEMMLNILCYKKTSRKKRTRNQIPIRIKKNE